MGDSRGGLVCGWGSWKGYTRTVVVVSGEGVGDDGGTERRG